MKGRPPINRNAPDNVRLVKPPPPRLGEVHRQRVEQAWTAFLERVNGAGVTPEDVHAFACMVAHIKTRKLAPCVQCGGMLSAREQLRPCKLCGFRGNSKIYYSEAGNRQKKEKP